MFNDKVYRIKNCLKCWQLSNKNKKADAIITNKMHPDFLFSYLTKPTISNSAFILLEFVLSKIIKKIGSSSDRYILCTVQQPTRVNIERGTKILRCAYKFHKVIYLPTPLKVIRERLEAWMVKSENFRLALQTRKA